MFLACTQKLVRGKKSEHMNDVVLLSYTQDFSEWHLLARGELVNSSRLFIHDRVNAEYSRVAFIISHLNIGNDSTFLVASRTTSHLKIITHLTTLLMLSAKG